MAMRIPVQTPEFSESVKAGTLLEWHRQEGEAVARDEVIAEIETDKVILELTAPAAGVLAKIHVAAGGEVRAGMTLAEIETEAGALVASTPTASMRKNIGGDESALRPSGADPNPEDAGPGASVCTGAVELATPDAADAGMAAEINGAPVQEPVPCTPCPERQRTTRRVAMSRLRQRIAERMLEAQRTAAILTTFNEIDMRPVQELRQRYQERFQREHGVKLGLMSFFVKAACQALKAYPILNARVDGSDIVYHDYYDIGVAVSSERGLVVPVLRDADTLSFAAIERAIADFARRANALELRIEELEGGTFTISNGGVFGSLLSTPILNPPQSGVLGLHRIQDRPVAIDGQVAIRPMMYVALSYDHRIVDGREAVSFLRVLKESIEDPASLLLEL